MVLLQTGETIPVAIKTCKNASADVKEKFLSEAGEFYEEQEARK